MLTALAQSLLPSSTNQQVKQQKKRLFFLKILIKISLATLS
jgi:hypothetical protein